MENAIKYDGKEPFVFISYSHKDHETANQIFKRLNLHRCRFWYDADIHLGEDWSEDIATHIKDAACVLLFISKNSIGSDYVKDEIHVARTLKKSIIPVYIEEIELPLGLELTLGRTQGIHLEGYNYDALCNKIVRNLPESVIDRVAQPFFIDGDTVYYFCTEEIYSSYVDESVIRNFKVYSRSTADDSIKIFYEYDHDRFPMFTGCELADVHVYKPKYVDYTCMILTLSLYFYAPYPSYVTDLYATMTFAIYIDEKGAHKNALLNLSTNADLNPEDYNDRPALAIMQKIRDSFFRPTLNAPHL